MGFGNPYGDAYNEENSLHWTDEIVKLDVNIISLTDTVGLASAAQVGHALQNADTPVFIGCVWRSLAFFYRKQEGKAGGCIKCRCRRLMAP